MKRMIAVLLIFAVSLGIFLVPCAAAATYPFLDVKKDAWYADAVRYVYQNRLFAGTDKTTFSPNIPLTRAMLVSVLWRREESPAVPDENPFSDVPQGEWYTDGVVWAAANGIVSGMGDGKFSPNSDITREQLAAIMMRYTQYLSVEPISGADLSSFADTDKVSGWAKEAVSWANAAGILSGLPENGLIYLDPQGSATRAQTASLLQRYIINILGIPDDWDGEIEEPVRELGPYDPDETAAEFAQEVLRLVNIEREKAGVSPLEYSETLGAVALLKARDMVEYNYFSHESPNYGWPDEMLDSFGIEWRCEGENIAAGQRTPQEVMDDWMGSPGHRANILDPNYTKLGVGYCSSTQGYRSYWVQTFTD